MEQRAIILFFQLHYFIYFADLQVFIEAYK